MEDKIRKTISYSIETHNTLKLMLGDDYGARKITNLLDEICEDFYNKNKNQGILAKEIKVLQKQIDEKKQYLRKAIYEESIR